MKKIKFLFLFFPVLILAACSGNNPEAVAEKFNEALYMGDFETAKSFCTDDSKQAVDFVAAFASKSVEQMKKCDVQYEVKNVTMAEDGNSAVVEGVVNGSLDLQKNEVQDSVVSKLNLVKNGNKWLVEYKLK
ncbi:MAG: DUF4878 domain-containing protein [Paludibacter sp.]|nr:DUF4878 domain-containing protein [Paludibacter sp.]